MSTLDRAITLAVDAHAGQVDKCGQPYILHPLRVMLAMTTDGARIAAVLHDVVEDTGFTFACLAARGFRDHVETLDRLTRRTHETYATFVERCAEHPVAKAVKVADIRDNLSPIRVEKLPADVRQSLGLRYRKALHVLGAGPDPQARLPETHVNGGVAPLTHEAAGILIDVRPMSYQNAVQAALKIIPMIREADQRAGVRA